MFIRRISIRQCFTISSARVILRVTSEEHAQSTANVGTYSLSLCEGSSGQVSKFWGRKPACNSLRRFRKGCATGPCPNKRRAATFGSGLFRVAILRRFFAKGSSWDLEDRKSTRLNSSHPSISYAVFCLKKKTWKNVSQLSTRQRITRT